MTLSRDDAARALGEVETAGAQAMTLARYARQGGALVAWGLVWLVCNLVSQFAPRSAGEAWLVGVLAGLGATAWISRRASRPVERRRSALAFLVIALLLFGLFAVSPPRSYAAIDAVISLCVAAAYALVGIWAGTRWLVLGAALFTLILLGWVLAPAGFFLWMALVGGGALVLGGLWLRSA